MSRQQAGPCRRAWSAEQVLLPVTASRYTQGASIAAAACKADGGLGGRACMRAVVRGLTAGPCPCLLARTHAVAEPAEPAEAGWPLVAAASPPQHPAVMPLLLHSHACHSSPASRRPVLELQPSRNKQLLMPGGGSCRRPRASLCCQSNHPISTSHEGSHSLRCLECVEHSSTSMQPYLHTPGADTACCHER